MTSDALTRTPGGEAMARQFVMGKRFFLHEFGIDTRTVHDCSEAVREEVDGMNVVEGAGGLALADGCANSVDDDRRSHD